MPKTRVYLPGRKVAHLVDSWPVNAVSLCRVWAEFWGTGSQEEYEKAASLPLCKRCLARNGGDDA